MSDCQIIHILQITFYSIVFTSILTYVDTILGLKILWISIVDINIFGLVPATASTEDGSTRIVVYRGWGDEGIIQRMEWDTQISKQQIYPE